MARHLHPERGRLNSAGKSIVRVETGQIAPVLKRILAENGRDYLGQYAIAALCLLVIAGTTAFSAWIMRDVIDEIFYRQRSDLIALISLTIVAAFMIRGIATYVQAVILARVGNDLVARYQRRLFDHLMTLHIGYFSDTRSGQLAAQISQNVTGIRDLLSLTLTSVARDLVTLIGLVVVMVTQDWLLSLFSLLIGPPIAIAAAVLMRKLRTVTRQSVEVNARLIGSMQEATQGIQIVKAFTMEALLSEKLSALIASAEAQANKIARVSERLSPIAETLAGFAVAGVIAYAGYRATQFQQPPGAVFSFITALLLAYDPVRRLARLQVSLERALVNARMIYEILDLKPRQGDSPDARPLAVSRGEVAFEGVTFAYPDGLPVLSDVSFVAEAGRTTALVGGSGAGKTTLTALLLRFHDLAAGRIAIDGQDIAAVTKQSLRRSIAYVSQQPYLFEGTIRDNIRYGRPDATDSEVEAAARIAQADAFIRAQAQGYETPLGENGASLSGGQRQRLSIARAIVREAPILVLDEATSALDNESEAAVQAALSAFMKGRTTIVIAHRLSTVVNADKIVVLDGGRVAEEGSHAVLSARQGGIYARFHRLRGDRDLGLVADADAAATDAAEPAGTTATGRGAAVGATAPRKSRKRTS
ncbi:MAG: ABC transporter ATP-binding protein [Rhizobiaceae bacterium]|nr:ABC transporter ATP-binding protein [Rhizobiaceae bacterium]